MGGTQSLERVVTVEDGDAEITVTEDFVRYVADQEGSSSGEEQSRTPQPFGPEDVPPYISAEELLTGEAQPIQPPQRDKNSSYWKSMYEQEKRKNDDLKHLTGAEYSNAVAEVREKFVQASLDNAIPVCEECKDRVLDCYHSNPNKILECSTVVKQYMECVETAKTEILHASTTIAE